MGVTSADSPAFLFPSTTIVLIRSELVLYLCSAPELLSSLHRLPGCCRLAIHPCLAAQRLLPLRAAVTAATSYLN